MCDKASKITEQLKTFRELLLLPKPKDLDFENWLENFQDQGEKELAAHILKQFIYFSDDIIDQMLRVVVGRCGYFFMKNNSTWNHKSFKEKCWYSFIQGENPNDATDSGYIFTRKLREVLHIPDKRIIKFEALFKKLEDNRNIPQNVILVDDFVGSGLQTVTAWNKYRLGASKKSLNELQKLSDHCIVYAPLIVNDMGKSRITSNCPNLHLEYIYNLGPEYNLFNVNGLCWAGDNNLHNRFLEMMKRIAQEQGIPITNGNDVNDMKGFWEQGLSLAFHHGIPDACPAFFYWDTPSWKPLKTRSYHR
ncbi:phosphoribosyltransferase-like protein [Prevotella intermedia]|uniref:phosphoribosyltransferase-like protein n=1 Tax=Prevotella intermedia TaxID=28131 RepID=UPI00200692CE|nr:hypothetical protein [Prevotella intermedia]MCK6144956.1 hypothetical protein [Prevotella intermedia]